MMTDDRKEQTKVGANGEAQASLCKQVGAKFHQLHLTSDFGQETTRDEVSSCSLKPAGAKPYQVGEHNSGGGPTKFAKASRG